MTGLVGWGSEWVCGCVGWEVCVGMFDKGVSI